MALEIRIPNDDEWPAICHADGRAFGFNYTAEAIEERRVMHDLGRFRVAFDDGRIVAVAGSYALDVTLPGGTTVPMGGVTWVSTASTHRRQGLMKAVVDAVHDDIDDRGEPVASLSASEGGIYERRGYGIATRVRLTSIDPRQARIRSEFAAPSGAVSFVDGDDVFDVVSDVWERFRRNRAGEINREATDHEFMINVRSKPLGNLTPALYLRHADGFATYRIEERWNDGHPAHHLVVVELVAVTAEAHLALWQSLLSIDLIGEITSRAMPIDDPLPFLLENQRVVRTTGLNDGVWVNVRDIGIAFGNRTYCTDDRLVVEVDGKRWAIDGGPDGASCKAVKTKPDLVTDHASFSSLLYGGVVPSALVAGRRMTARNADALRRADLFFPTSLAPHCQSQY